MLRDMSLSSTPNPALKTKKKSSRWDFGDQQLLLLGAHTRTCRLVIDTESCMFLPLVMFVAQLVFSYTASVKLQRTSRLIWSLMAFTVWVYLTPSVSGEMLHSISPPRRWRSFCLDCCITAKNSRAESCRQLLTSANGD